MIKKQRKKLKPEPLLVEWMVDGNWMKKGLEHAEVFRAEAEKGLQNSPQRYWYPDPDNRFIRVSYYEGR